MQFTVSTRRSDDGERLTYYLLSIDAGSRDNIYQCTITMIIKGIFTSDVHDAVNESGSGV